MELSLLLAAGLRCTSKLRLQSLSALSTAHIIIWQTMPLLSVQALKCWSKGHCLYCEGNSRGHPQIPDSNCYSPECVYTSTLQQRRNKLQPDVMWHPATAYANFAQELHQQPQLASCGGEKQVSQATHQEQHCGQCCAAPHLTVCCQPISGQHCFFMYMCMHDRLVCSGSWT